MGTSGTQNLGLIIFSLIFIVSTFSIDCNSTHFEFYSKFSLGKQQQLNITFLQIQPLIKVPNTVYRANDSSTFTIYVNKVQFQYLDSKQKAVIIGRDTVGVYGGILQATISYNWSKSNMMFTINGTGQSKILSEQIMFEKNLQIDQGYLDFRLAFYYNVSFDFTKFSLTRVDPPNTAQSDIGNIINSLNIGELSTKEGLKNQINKYYPQYLKQNLKNEHYPLDDHFDYEWKNPWTSKSISIPFYLIPTGVDLEPAGLSLTFVSYIKDDSKWKCGKAIPTNYLNTQIYGGLQQFISFTVFSNSVRYAFQKGFLNTELNRINWESKFFQFFAGDLYEVIPEVANKFTANEVVTGNCTYNPTQQVEVLKHNSTTINTTTAHNCSLYIKDNKVADFGVKLLLKVDISSNETNLNFKVIDSSADLSFNIVQGFELKNKQLAKHMIQHSLMRLKQGHTFGSGWKIFPRDYAHVLLVDDHIVIYDSTHVDASLI